MEQSSRELKEFARILVSGTDEDNEDVETCEDSSHNLLTYKLNGGNTIIKWYRKTQTLLVQGANHSVVKGKLLDVLHEGDSALNFATNQNAESVIADPAETVDNIHKRDLTNSPQESKQNGKAEKQRGNHCDCPTVEAELAEVKNALLTLSKQLMHMQRTPRSHESEEQSLNEENDALRLTLRERENQVKNLELERMSLITALMHEDQQTVKGGSPRKTNDRDHFPPSAQDQKEGQTNDQGTWTTVESRKNRKAAATDSRTATDGRKTGRKITIIGDSLVKNIQGNKISRTHQISTRSFPGSLKIWRTSSSQLSGTKRTKLSFTLQLMT